MEVHDPDKHWRTKHQLIESETGWDIEKMK